MGNNHKSIEKEPKYHKNQCFRLFFGVLGGNSGICYSSFRVCYEVLFLPFLGTFGILKTREGMYWPILLVTVGQLRQSVFRRGCDIGGSGIQKGLPDIRIRIRNTNTNIQTHIYN